MAATWFTWFTITRHSGNTVPVSCMLISAARAEGDLPEGGGPNDACLNAMKRGNSACPEAACLNPGSGALFLPGVLQKHV
jgi:hypothetical protein